MRDISKGQPRPSPLCLIYYGVGRLYLYSWLKQFCYSELFKPFEFSFGKKDILYLFLAMKHPHLWRCFYFDMVKDQPKLHEWNILMEKAYSFSEWYHTTPRSDRAYLCPITLEKTTPATETITLVHILQKSYINGNFDRERKNEDKAIQKYVEEFVLDITMKIGRSNKKFTATPILSGSVAEGTKVGFPDEYDFILHLEELQDEFDQTTIKANIEAKPHLEVEMELAPLFQEYLDSLNEQVKKHEHSQGFCLHQSVESRSIRPFTIILSYTGIFF